MIHGSPEITPQGAEEPQLLTRARGGDAEAFAALYNEHRPMVSRYITGRVRDRDLVEDLTQDVFLRALNRMETFTWQGRDFGAWLVTIARNIVTDYYKSSRYRREWPVETVYDTDVAPAGSVEDTVIRRLEADEARDRVTGAIASLTYLQKTVITRRYLDELSIADTAAAMGRSEGAIKTMTYRATQSLSRELRAYEAVAA